VPRAVLDPNVLISGLITPRGASAALIREFRSGAFEIVVSDHLLDELSRVLRRPKFRRYVTDEDVEAFLDMLRTEGTHAPDPPLAEVPTGPDPDDEYLIALARTQRVDALVSGDPHLLRLSPAIPVFGPRAFLDRLSG